MAASFMQFSAFVAVHFPINCIKAAEWAPKPPEKSKATEL